MTNRGNFLTASPPSFTSTSTGGMFKLNDVAILRAANQYPRGPVAPTSLTASAGSAQLLLSWTAPTTTHGTITNYLVEYTASGGSAQYVLTGSTSTSYTLTGLTNGTSYTVRVAAVNFTAGDYSTTATATPVAGNVPGTVQNLRFTQSGCVNQGKPYIVEWNAPASDGGSAITGYAYKFSVDGAASTTASTSLSYIDGPDSRIYVAAVNGIGTGQFTDSGLNFQDC